MHVGAGGTVGSQRARMAASVTSRYALGADGVGAARPGARGSRVTASRYAVGAEGGGAARPGSGLGLGSGFGFGFGLCLGLA